MKYFLLCLSLCLTINTYSQYNVLYENSFRNWAPGQGWVILNNDTVSKSAGAITDGFFGGVPVPFYLEIYDYMLGVDQTLSATDKVMITPAIVLGSNSFVRYYSNYTAGSELSLWVINNQNDTLLSGLTDSLGNSLHKGFNVFNLSAYSGDTVRLAFRIRGLVSKAIIDNLLVLDKYSLAWIPDSCFRSYLMNTVPSAFVGDSLNFLDSNVIYKSTISNPGSCMNSLEGLQYFVSLRYLNVPNNHISYIPPDKINFLDSANAENNYLPLFPDAPYCTSLRLNNNLIKTFPDLYNGILSVLQLKYNLIYDCFMCSNRFLLGDFTGNILTGTEGCYYYNMIWSAPNNNLPAVNCSQKTGYIKGKAFFDLNQNSTYDTTEIVLANQHINYFQGTDLTTFFNGTYSVGVDSGLVNMTLTALPPGFICNTPLYDTIDVGDVINHDFIVTATSNFSNLSVALGSTGITRLKESLTFSMNVKNLGTQVTSGTLKIYMPPGYTLLSLQNGSIVNDTLIWNISNLNPFGQINNMITIRVDSFPINQVTLFKANLYVAGDIDTSNNSSVTEVLIRDSTIVVNPPNGYPYDPNNKLVDKPIVDSGFQDYLTYNINFENIGTGNASRVIVRDFISGKLDINSFELLGTSHPCILSYGSDSLLQFLFDPIVLPPTSADSLNSTGHIWFRIKPKNPVYLNDTIYNSAGIYFDSQPVVNTNPSTVYVNDTTIHGASFTSNLTTICFNSNRNVQFTNHSGDIPLSIEWYFPGGTPSFSTNANPLVNYSTSGDYDVTLIAKYLNYDDTLIKQAYIHVVPVVDPVIILAGNDSICKGDSVQLSSNISAVNYLWSTGQTTSSTYALSTGYYYLTITDANGCRMGTYKSIKVLDNPLPVISGDDTICNGTSVAFQVGTFPSYLWSTGSTTQSILVQQSGLYIVTVTSAFGCKGIDTMELIVSNASQPVITGPNIICNGDQALLSINNIYNNYIWSTGDTSTAITVNMDGLYTVTVTDTLGCSGSDTFQLSVIHPDPLMANFDTICTNHQLLLDAGSGFVTYNWSTTETTQQINVSAPGYYVVTVTDTNNCVGSDSLLLSLYNSVQPSITGSIIICAGDTGSLNAGIYNSYLWSTGSTSSTIAPILAGIYSVTVTDANGCTGSDSIVFSVNPMPDTSVLINGNTLTSQAFTAVWQWIYCDSTNINNESSNVFTASQTGSYAVIINQGGCIDTSSCIYILISGFDILTENPFNIYPNPTDHYLNLTKPDGISNLSIKIYTATGQLVQNMRSILINKITIDMSSYETGLYLVEVNTERSSFRYRIIVNHD